MNSKSRHIHLKSGLSLIEVMLAMLILAVSFIPIIGVMGSASRVTDKDNRTIKAMGLCQAKLNKVLQFPFYGQFNPDGGEKAFGTSVVQTYTASQINVKLGSGEDVDGINFDSRLVTKDIAQTFSVPIYDALKKGISPNNPSNWGFAVTPVTYSRVYTRYILTVKWKDAGSASDKWYSLVSFKAKTRTE